MSQPVTQMVFVREDSPAKATVSVYADGMANITVENTEVPAHACDVELSLGQMIGLRDFLNRGIDDLALAQAGSLAVRSSDDPTQMAAVEEVLVRCMDGSGTHIPPAFGVGVDTTSGAPKVNRGCGRRFQYTKGYKLSCGEQSPFGSHSALCPDCITTACANAVESLVGVLPCGGFCAITRAQVLCPSCCEQRERPKQSNNRSKED